MTNRNIAILATLATLVAAPAYALDQDTAATTVNSGRYFGQQVSNIQSNVYASARKVHVPSGAYASARQDNSELGARDFQLEGRGLGE